MNEELLSEEEIAKMVFDSLSPISKATILAVKQKTDMIEFHHSAGGNIRNEYKLWQRGYTPVIVDGVDVAEDHPDAISARILERVWELVHEDTLYNKHF